MNDFTGIERADATEISPQHPEIFIAVSEQLTFLYHRRRRLASSEVSDVEWAILLEAYFADGLGKFQRTLSFQTVAGIPLTTMLRYLDELERKGLIQRETLASDRRVKLVAITARGRRVVAGVFEPELATSRGVAA